ncbi:MAG: hypothetical protein ACK56Q_01860, partial [Pirellulaceae bacterium]
EWLMRIARELHQTLQTIGIEELQPLEATDLGAIEPSVANLFQIAYLPGSTPRAAAEQSRSRGKS